METKIINNRYELIACTAVATEAGDTEVQDAIYSRSTETSPSVPPNSSAGTSTLCAAQPESKSSKPSRIKTDNKRFFMCIPPFGKQAV